MRTLAVVSLGRVGYREAHALQRQLCDRRISGDIPTDLFLLLEHDRTITLGRGTRPGSLPLAADELVRRGLDVVEVERGGDVTWHGPGQLVAYPILNLTEHKPDLHWYLRQVEEALIRGLASLGIVGERYPGQTGVWTGGRKIASIGIHVRQWVTTHGFALNVSNSLDDFGLIVPCGISGVEMTSVARELELGESAIRRFEVGASATRRLGDSATRRLGDSATRGLGDSALWEGASAAVTEKFAEVFGLEPKAVGLAELLPQGTGVAPSAL